MFSERDDAARVDAVVRPRRQFWSANASTSTMVGVLPAWLISRRVVADLVLLDRHQQDVHVAARAAALEHLVVEVTSLMSKGMYCSASQWIDSASSSARHRGQADLLDDDRVPRERRSRRRAS